MNYINKLGYENFLIEMILDHSLKFVRIHSHVPKSRNCNDVVVNPINHLIIIVDDDGPIIDFSA